MADLNDLSVTSPARWIMETWDGEQFRPTACGPFENEDQAYGALSHHVRVMPNCPARVKKEYVCMEYSPVRRPIDALSEEDRALVFDSLEGLDGRELLDYLFNYIDEKGLQDMIEAYKEACKDAE